MPVPPLTPLLPAEFLEIQLYQLARALGLEGFTRSVKTTKADSDLKPEAELYDISLDLCAAVAGRLKGFWSDVTVSSISKAWELPEAKASGGAGSRKSASIALTHTVPPGPLLANVRGNGGEAGEGWKGLEMGLALGSAGEV